MKAEVNECGVLYVRKRRGMCRVIWTELNWQSCSSIYANRAPVTRVDSTDQLSTRVAVQQLKPGRICASVRHPAASGVELLCARSSCWTDAVKALEAGGGERERRELR
ncbi:hypothetical protein SRHO_G00332480 [Serrasalmus rhombeus]